MRVMKFLWTRILLVRGFLSLVVPFAIFLVLNSGKTLAAEGTGFDANTSLLPTPLTMSAMEAGTASSASSWQDIANAGVDDASRAISASSQVVSLFETVGEIASKAKDATEFTKLMTETGKYAEAFGKVFGIINEAIDLAELSLQLYDCYTGLVQDNEEAFVSSFNDLVRELVISLGSMGGEAIGAAIGGLLGSLATPIVGVIGKCIGGFFGKKFGKDIAEKWLYPLIDDFMIDIGRKIFDFLKPPQSLGICNDLKYAAFANGAYNGINALEDLLPFDQQQGWQEVQPNIDEYDKKIGFSATTYEHKNAQGEVDEVVVSFRGSDKDEIWKDWIINNLPNFLGAVAPQYTRAAELAKEVKAKHPNAKVSLTGHSLGGGLAQYAAAKANLPAVTFNPAAPAKILSIKSYDYFSELRDQLHNITNYVHSFDPLQMVNAISFLHPLFGFGTWKMGTDVVIPGPELLLDAHGMATMWDYFADTCIASDGTSGGSGGEEKKVEDDNPEEDKGEDGSSKPSPGIILPPITPQPLIPPIPGGTLPPGSDIGKPKKPGGSMDYQRHKKYDVFVK